MRIRVIAFSGAHEQFVERSLWNQKTLAEADGRKAAVLRPRVGGAATEPQNLTSILNREGFAVANRIAAPTASRLSSNPDYRLRRRANFLPDIRCLLSIRCQSALTIPT